MEEWKKGSICNAEAPQGPRNCPNAGFQEGRAQNLGLVGKRGREEADTQVCWLLVVSTALYATERQLGPALPAWDLSSLTLCICV